MPPRTSQAPVPPSAPGASTAPAPSAPSFRARTPSSSLSAAYAGPILAAATVIAAEATVESPVHLAAPLLFLIIAFSGLAGGTRSGAIAAAVTTLWTGVHLFGASAVSVGTRVELLLIAVTAPGLAALAAAGRSRLYLSGRSAAPPRTAARIADLTPEPVVIHDGRIIVHANAAALSLLGGTQPTEVIGARLASIGYERPASDAAIELRLRRPDGRTLDIEILETRVPGGGRRLYRALLREIGGRRLAERRLAAEHAVTRILAEATTFEDAAPRILAAIGQQLGWLKAGFWTPDPRDGRLRLEAAWHRPEPTFGRFLEVSRTYRFAPGEGLPGRVWADRAPVWIPDVTIEPNFPRAGAAAAEGLHAALGFPVTAGDVFFGVMEFFDREIAAPDPALLDMLAAIGAEIGVLIRKTRAESELRRSKRELEAILGGAAEGITAQARDGSLIFANDAAARLYGFQSAGEMLAAPLDQIVRRFEVLDADGLPYPLERLPGRRALSGVEAPRQLLRFRIRGSNDEHWSLVRATPVFDEAGEVRMAINLFSDITEIMRSQEALADANARYESLTSELRQTLDQLRERTLESEATRAELHVTAEGLRLLSDASALLASSPQQGESLQTIARRAAVHMADYCQIWLRDGDSLRVATAAHRDSTLQTAVQELANRYSLSGDDASPILDAVRTGTTQLLDERGLRAAAGDGLTSILPSSSLLVAPLVARANVIGAIALASAQPHGFDDSAVSLAEELGRRIALAVDNARLFRAADAARVEAEHAAAGTARLQEITASLSRSVTPREVAAVVLQHAQAALVADAAAVAVVRSRAGADELDITRWSGLPRDAWRGHRRLAVDAAVPAAEAFRRRELVHAADGAAVRSRFPDLVEPWPALEAWIAVPLMVEQAVVGVLSLGFAAARQLAESERSFLEALALQAAQALDRARLFESERTARDSAERAEERLSFISEASATLARSLDLSATLEHAARLAAAGLADLCIVRLIGEDGSTTACEVSCATERAPEDLAELRRVIGERAGRGSPFEQVLLTGESLLAGDLRRDLPGLSAAERDLLARLQIRAAMVVPLLAHGRRLGSLAFLSASARKRFTAEDLHLAQELARRVSLAIDNARLYGDAQEANRAKSDFLAVVSHELRTPLNAVVGYSDLLSSGVSGDLNATQSQYLERVKASAMHLLQLIEEILTFARTEAGREELRIADVDLTKLARDAAASIEPMVTAKDLELRLELPDGPLVAITDPQKVRQVLLNLLSNALKFTATGTITLRLELHNGDVCLYVSDTGIGIAPEHLERVFEPFWQVQQGTTRQAGGAGLGLSVVRRLVRLLGGGVELTSRQSGGSTFSVRLPQHASAPPASA